MSRIGIVSASAGSGKTHRLASILEKAVKDGSVRAEAVIATTFTRKASAELRERVRQRLLRAGMNEEALQMNAAVMGTVNAVCGRIVTDYAFDLGLSPELRMLDEDMAGQALKHALSDVLKEGGEADTARLKEVFYDWKIEAIVEKVVEHARSNRLDAADLESSRRRSEAELEAMLGQPLSGAEGAALERTLVEDIEAFLKLYKDGGDTTKKTKGCAEKAEIALDSLKIGKPLRWQEWSQLAKLDAAKRCKDVVSPIASAAARHIHMTRFHDDLKAAVAAVFGLAAAALESYREYKEERGLIDFTDQECLALRLLENPDVRARMEDLFDIVLVDEFQDTSPIQLAIFLKLAGISRRSVWVGDQKQSIFAFREADPELMNAVIDQICKGGEPDSLHYSWRSRPGLVRLTSELFAAAFPRHGIPAPRIRLEPAPPLAVEPAGLGPVVERWRPKAQGRRKADKLAALAAGIRELLDDPSVRVRDKNSADGLRRVEPRDIAVLCRRNSTCAGVASALAAIGIKSAAARLGLMKTPETRLVLAALQLWSDPENALPAAEIARILEYPDDADPWLEALLRNPGAAAFAGVEAVRKIREASRGERPELGVLAAFDRVMEILGIRDICRRWGDAFDRLANLSVLRSKAVEYLGFSADEGAGASTTGLATFLAGLADDGGDERAYTPESEDAVVVSSWHGAKGLEWPIVVLCELDFDFKWTVPGVHVDSDTAAIDLGDPLAGRWIRYWPNPYHRGTKNAYHELVAGHEVFRKRMAVESRESLRLLYVGWTRAKDRLVLCGAEDKLSGGMLAEFRNNDGVPLLVEPLKGDAEEAGFNGGSDGINGESSYKATVDWGGLETEIIVRTPTAAAPAPPPLSSEPTYDTPGPRDHPPASAWPDLTAAEWEAGDPESVGEPIAPKTAVAADRMKDVGNAVHGFLAADRTEYGHGERLAMAGDLLERWGVPAALSPEDLVTIADRLRAWVKSRWPGAVRHREQPSHLRLDSGSIAGGVTDLLLETAKGLVAVDHKAYTARPDQARELAAADAPQVHLYAETAAEAIGKPVLGAYIHFPLLGVVVPVRRVSQSLRGNTQGSQGEEVAP